MSNTIKNLLYTLGALLLLAGIINAVMVGAQGTREYNRHMCAVYGYAEDCKTPLEPDQRLK